MKAVELMGPNHLEIREVETPMPGPQDVLSRVQATAVCGSDVSLISKPWEAQPPHGSFIIGHEYAGIVAAVGRGLSMVGLKGKRMSRNEVAALLGKRKKKWKAPSRDRSSGILKRYTMHAASAMKGAYLED